MSLVEFLVLTLAVFRLARLVIFDTIAEPFRDFFLTRWPGQDVEYDPDDKVRGGTFLLEGKLYAQEPTVVGDRIAKLLSCVWCAGFWLSLIVVAAYAIAPVQTFWAALVLAVSGLAGIVLILMGEEVE